MKVRYSYLKEKFGDRALRKLIYGEFDKLLDKGDFTLGAAVTQFENSFAKLVGAKHAIGVANGTDALRLSLKACGVGPGDEVILCGHGFIASAGAIAELGATPVFVDATWNFVMEPFDLERAITERTKAILPVHFTGEPCDMTAIMSVAQKHGLSVVEDCAQAVLAEWRGVKCGNFGRAAGFSLHPLKNLNVWGDGGMIVTNDTALDAELRLMRNHGLKDRDTVTLLGCNSRLDTLQAIVGNALIGQTVWNTEKRRKNAAYYDAELGKIDQITIPDRYDEALSCFHLYVCYAEDRNSLVRHLNQRGIEAKIHYPVPIYRQPAFPYRSELSQCDRISAETFTLPVDEHLAVEQQAYIVKTIREFFSA